MQHIKVFSQKFKEETPTPITIPRRYHPALRALPAARSSIRTPNAGNASDAGRGDGPSLPDLKDDWGHPIWPADLTQCWNFRGGSTHQDIFRAFMTGLSGTPMPSFADIFEPQQAWDLTNYVRSLCRDRNGHFCACSPR